MKSSIQNLFLILALCAGIYPAAAQSFVVSSTNAVGGAPLSVVAADVNGDGHVDLISANESSNSVSVLTNNGSGGFVLSGTYAVGSDPTCVIAVDVNGDGKVDLVTANFGNNTLTVLTNDGSGGFASNATYTVGVQPVCVVAADLNGDGHPDLICANYGTNTLTVLTNNGSGGFVTASSPGLGSVGITPNDPYSVCAADVNGDGHLDLISANLTTGTLLVLTNDGSGNFNSNATYTVTTGGEALTVIAADVNGDGKVDLISSGYNGNLVMVLTNNGSGGFVTSGTYTVGGGPFWVRAADVNGDGKLDLISANQLDNTLTVLTNSGNGNFSTSTTCNVGNGDRSLCVADVNGDGKLDLISANQYDNTLTVLTNTMTFPSPAQSFVISSTNAVGSNPQYVIAADVNGDGHLDLVTMNVNDASISVLTNNGSSGFVTSGTYVVSLHAPTSVCAADVNGDGKVDLITADYDDFSGESLTVLTNNGSGGFAVASSPDVGNAPIFVCAADVNGDGYMDLISANAAAGLSVVTGNGSGGFAFSSNPRLAPSGRTAGVCVMAADVNGDGNVDLIGVNNHNTDTLVVLTNNGSGGFITSGTYTVGNTPVSTCAADVNGDGKVDLICANYGSATLSVFTNNGIGNFALSTNLPVGNVDSVCAADVNGDGKMDLICANQGAGKLSVWTNNGTGFFMLAANISVGSGPLCVIAADVNGDGRIDLISANSDNTLRVFTNNFTFPPPASTPPVAVATVGNVSGTGLVVSWPSASAGWTLQQTPGLGTTHWGAAGFSGYTINDNGTNKNLYIPPPPGGSAFFRMMHP